VALGILAEPAASEPLEVPDPGPTDTCPVCGMFVTKYPDWVATLVFKGGPVLHFDGVKDLFKALFDLPRYVPGRTAEDIQTIAATEYYGLAQVDARTAWFVLGSDVLGPMGHELIPLANEEDAREFMQDHQGQRILRFEEITPEVIRELDGARH
jgi:nitrous oxide reductase accessory protein NosL